MKTNALLEARSAVLRRSFKKDFPSAVRGEGPYIWDAEGNRYVDFAGSAAVNLIGHGVREISAAMAEQAAKLEFVHTSQFTTPVAEEYSQELLEFAGENFRGGAVFQRLFWDTACGIDPQAIERRARLFSSKPALPGGLRGLFAAAGLERIEDG